MRDDATSGSGALALLGIVLVLLLLVGGAGFYWLIERQQQATAAAVEQARAAVAATEAERQAAVARVEAKLDRAKAEAGGQVAAGDSLRRESEVGDQETGIRSQESGDAVRAEVESVLREQQEAWNGGDVEAFAEHYWKSDDLTFSSGGKTTRGWEETLRGYRERYPTREKMGRLSFTNLEITPLGESAALVLGEWRLERDSEPVSGNFSLVFRKLDGRWAIVHDHTSRE
jgi:ketosteroid isomerase-like protein